MKKFIFFARVSTWLSLVLPFAASAQDSLDIYPNYVVIGAFAHHNNAIHFTDDANRNNFPAKFQMNPNRNLYYVYVLTTDDREYAIAEALRLRADTKYFDTWVYSGVLGQGGLATRGGRNVDFDPVTGRQLRDPGNRDASQSTNQELAIRTGQAQGNRQSESNSETQVSARRSGASLLPQQGEGNEGNMPSNQRNGQTGGRQQTQDQGQLSGDALKNQGTSGNTSTARKNRSTSDLSTRDGSTTPNESARADGMNGTDTSAGKLSGNDGSNTNGATTDNQTTFSDRSTSTEGPSRNNGLANTNGSALEEGSTTNNAPGSNDDATSLKNTNSAAENAQTRVNAGTTTSPISDRDRRPLPGPPPVRATTAPLSSEEVVGKNFFLYLFRADNHNMVPGEVDAIDVEKSRRMATYEANVPVKVIMPSGKTKQISFVCQVFGYRKMQKEFSPDEPASDFYLDKNGNLVVPFELMRLQKGDIAIMYNVFFFKDAAIMRPESRFEVNNLLDLLIENPSYKIRIHGHTNGNAAGKIIRMGGNGDFYSLTDTKQGFGSAKQLSEDRAIVIRDFLISKGISADRMSVKAWGGKKPIQPKNSVRANENVRVEVEILSD